MKSQKEILFEAVISEARLIKKHANADEKAKCLSDKLDPDSAYSCIYGLMTGHCDSVRAIKLLGLCAVPYSGSFEVLSTANDFGLPVNHHLRGIASFSLRNGFSAIEFYIANAEDEGASIADFIQRKDFKKLLHTHLSLNEEIEDYLNQIVGY